ncbi:MAG: D-alanyl-D-alanine carboxypeptidase/D-alanyl-D-alanine-endopeptidase [Chlamydiales bacterium]
MLFRKKLSTMSLLVLASLSLFNVNGDRLPEKIVNIMQQSKYQHANWGLFAKDAVTGKVLFDLNSDQMFLPASTTKLFSVAALYHAYGDDYQFKTPVYALGSIQNGRLTGNLVLVAQGDLTMGGRQNDSNQIAYTKMDHIYANFIPGAILTEQDPLHGLNELAKQIQEKGIKEVDGDLLIDDRLFQTTEKRGMVISPMMINENVVDLIINPSEMGKTADLTWRPNVPGYVVKNEVKTVSKDESLDIKISSDELGKTILVQGTIPLGQKEIIRTFSIKDPNHFARAALIQALRAQGIVVNLPEGKSSQLPPQSVFRDLQPVAVWTSPPLTEYAKLILKVSHNLGADLIPLLLAVRKGEKTFDAGMRELGNFIIEEVKLSPDAFVLEDAAGGGENRLTPKGEVQLLDYTRKVPSKFTIYYNALPIQGIDGSLEDFGKVLPGAGKIRAKPGTGVSFNKATNQYFLTTQALTGYIIGQNGNLFEFMLVVNNAKMPEISDVFPIFEDLSQISSIIYEHTVESKLPKISPLKPTGKS